MLGKGVALKNSSRFSEAVAVFDEVSDRYGRDTDDLFREHVARALLDKANTLAAMGRLGDAIGTCDALLGRLSNPTNQSLVELLAISLMAKGDFLAN